MSESYLNRIWIEFGSAEQEVIFVASQDKHVYLLRPPSREAGSAPMSELAKLVTVDMLKREGDEPQIRMYVNDLLDDETAIILFMADTRCADHLL